MTDSNRRQFSLRSLFILIAWLSGLCALSRISWALALAAAWILAASWSLLRTYRVVAGNLSWRSIAPWYGILVGCFLAISTAIVAIVYAAVSR